jgi:signal transduction histidine kinase
LQVTRDVEDGAEEALRGVVLFVWALLSLGLLAGSLVRPVRVVEFLLHIALAALWLGAPPLLRRVGPGQRERAFAFLLVATALLLGAVAALFSGASSPEFACLCAVPLSAILLLAEAGAARALTFLTFVLAEVLLLTLGAQPSSVLFWGLLLLAAPRLAKWAAAAFAKRWRANAEAERLRGLTEGLAEAEKRRGQSERLALLGRFASNVAHDISNPLTFLSTNLQLLEREVESARAVDRITEVLRDMRRFGRSDGVGTAQPTEVPVVFEEALRLASARLRGSRLERVLGQRLPPVTVRRRRLVQVLANLLLNAADAVAAQAATERRIRVGAETAEDVVILWVEDSGPGLSVEAKQHLFEPFFTTKPPGKGMGLGLALSREYLEADGGTLSFESASGGGTRAVVTLPRGEAS